MLYLIIIFYSFDLLFLLSLVFFRYTCEPCVQVATPLLLWVIIYVNARGTRIKNVVRKPYISYARERSVLLPRGKLRSSCMSTMKFLMSLLI